MADSMASVLPLPFVPAMWTVGGRRRSGWPRAFSSRSMRPSERSMTFGWRTLRRSRTRSLRVLGTGRLRERLQGKRRQLGVGLAGGLLHDVAGGLLHDERLRGPVGAQQQVEQARQRLAQLEAVDHLVDHAVGQEVLGALEALGQLLADRLLD